MSNENFIFISLKKEKPTQKFFGVKPLKNVTVEINYSQIVVNDSTNRQYYCNEFNCVPLSHFTIFSIFSSCARVPRVKYKCQTVINALHYSDTASNVLWNGILWNNFFLILGFTKNIDVTTTFSHIVIHFCLYLYLAQVLRDKTLFNHVNYEEHTRQ